MELLTAALVGLGGSLHCVGMCGPLALALYGGGNRVTSGVTLSAPFIWGRLLYNGGRLITYALLGGLFGLLGGRPAPCRLGSRACPLWLAVSSYWLSCWACCTGACHWPPCRLAL
jgi:sulfite exporter TauE/SafE